MGGILVSFVFCFVPRCPSLSLSIPFCLGTVRHRVRFPSPDLSCSTSVYYAEENGILNSSFRTVFQNRFEIVSNCSLASPHKLRVLAHINWSLVDNGFFTVKRIVASSRLSVLWARWTLSFSLNRLVAILPIVGSSERHSTFGGNRPRDTDGVLRKEVQNFGPPF